MNTLIDWFVLLLIAGVVYINYHYNIIVHIVSYILIEGVVAIVAIFYSNVALLLSVLMYFFLTSYDIYNKKPKHKNYRFLNRMWRKILRLVSIVVCLVILLIVVAGIMYLLQYEFKYNHVRIANYFKKYRNFGVIALIFTAIYDISKYARIKCDDNLLEILLKNIINSIYNTNISNANISFVVKHQINRRIRSNKDIKNAILFCGQLKDKLFNTYNNVVLSNLIDTYAEILKYKYSNNKNDNLTLWELLSKSLFEITLSMSVILKIWKFNNMPHFMTIILRVLPFSIVVTVTLFILINFITYQLHFVDRKWLYNLRDAMNLIRHNTL